MSHPPPRRIVIDALAARFGGTAYAVVHLARHLARAADVEAVCVITRQGSIVHQGLSAGDGLKIVELPQRRRLELVDRLRWELVRLPGLVKRFHATDCITMAGILPVDVGVAVTSILFNPVPFQRGGVANRLRRAAIVRTARRSATVIGPTEAMANLVEPLIGHRPFVVPLGIERSRFTAARRPGTEVLVVADFYPHKRHDLVLGSWSRLPEPRPLLRLIGNSQPHEPWAARITAAITALDAGEKIVVEHGLSLSELAARYRSARVFLMPSELESFCMPLAEALSCGVPGVARGTPVLRETGGPGCVYVDGDDPRVWADALQDVLTGHEPYRALRRAGLQHAERYSFEQMSTGVLKHLGSMTDERARPTPPRDRSAATTALSVGLTVLLAFVVAASVVARERDSPLSPREATVIADPVGDANYGKGLNAIVPSPVSSLTPVVGDAWRRLDSPDGRANVTPRGTRSDYFQLGFIAYSGAVARRVAVQTTAGETTQFGTRGRNQYEVVTLGPLKATRVGVNGVALIPQDRGNAPIVLSPFDSHWLQPGQVILRQRSLRQRGPGGSAGQYVRVGPMNELHVTPGLSGDVIVDVWAAADRFPAEAEIFLGGKRSVAAIPTRAGRTRLGPFRSGRVVRLRFRGSGDRVLVSDIKVRPVRP